MEYFGRSGFWLFAILAVFAAEAGTDAASPRKPNIILIVGDDLGWADVGCNGSSFYRTPAIDRLASEGLRFSNAYAACQVCSPTRASFMTGKYPARLHLTDWLPGRGDRPDQALLRPIIRQELPIHEVTVAEVFRANGYTCASIGKWHLGGKGFLPEQQGFAVNVAGNQAGSPASYFYPYRGNRGSMPGLEKGTEGEYLTDRLTDEALRFITANRNRPFFLYLPHYAVHIPLAAKEQLVARYRDEKAGGAQTNIVYAAMMQSLDESVGRIAEKVRELGLQEDTILFFTSDNGGLSVREGPYTPATSNHPLRAGKGYLYEGGIRVPLIVWGSGRVQAGRVSDVPVSSVDFVPTVLQLAGVAPDGPLDGMSLAPLFEGRELPRRESLYWHYPHYSNQGGKPGGAVRSGDFKLIQFYEDGRLELYNLKADPGESKDLAETMRAKAMAMAQNLDSWRRAVNAQMMLPNPRRGTE